MTSRWDSYFMRSGAEFVSFWSDMARRGRPTLLVAGAGFDPRSTHCAEALVAAGVPIRQLVLVRTPSLGLRRSQGEAEANEESLRNLVDGEACEAVDITSAGGASAGMEISTLFAAKSFDGVADVIVDITGIPRALYFPLLGTLLQRSNNGGTIANLHVVVSEDSVVDRQIISEGGESADFLHGFRGQQDRESGETPLSVWIPLLGEGCARELTMIRGRVEPEETVPILPFPATDPRRADQLIDEYDHLLFGDWSVDPHNIVYAAERNPFDVCAHIISAASRYEEAFKIVAPVRIIVSSHAGKLLSVGCFLAAAQNRQIAVAHVQPTAYDLRSLALEAREPKHLVEMWLAGEVYA